MVNVYEDKGCHLEPVGKLDLINNGIFDACYNFNPVFILTKEKKFKLISIRIKKYENKVKKEK